MLVWIALDTDRGNWAMAEIKVRLPDDPGPRSNSKPRERYGILRESSWDMPGYWFVEKPEGGCWWVLKECCEIVE